MRVLFFFIFIFFPIKGFSQDYEGLWKGSLVSKNSLGNEVSYEFFLNFKGKYGISTINYEEKSAVFKFEYSIVDDSLTILEQNLEYSDPLSNGEWCKKKLILKYNFSENIKTLSGNWEGKTTFSQCTPGTVFLIKIINRP